MAFVKKVASTKTAAGEVKKPAAAAKKKPGFPPRKTGTAAKKRPAKRPGILQVKAPADFKPHFLFVQVKVEEDGILGGKIKATRYVGRFDFDVEDKKKHDMWAYDPRTVLGIQARLSAMTYKATKIKYFEASPKERAEQRGAHRLPKGVVFGLLLRIGRRTADNVLTVRIGKVFQSVKSIKTGRVSMKELERTDPVSRLFRRAGAILPIAFENVLAIPKRERATKRVADDE